MAGEKYAFVDAFGHAYTIKHDLETLYNRPISLAMFTDSKQVFDVLTKASYPTERRLMVDVAAVRESYNTYEISNIGLVSGKDNPSDALTKPNFGAPLMRILQENEDCTPVTQWVFRAGSHTSSSHSENTRV